MIAVFTKTQREFARNFRFEPRNNFVRIKSVENVFGRKFTGVVLYTDWYSGDRFIRDAYEQLKTRQPELFE